MFERYTEKMPAFDLRDEKKLAEFIEKLRQQ